MAGVNRVLLLGHLGKDPETRHLESGSVVSNFSLATTEGYKDRQGNRVNRTEWHEIELWDGLAKVAEQYLKKGDMVYLEGKIKTETWQDNDGNNRKTVRIQATTMTMLSKGENQGSSSNSTAVNDQHKPNPDLELVAYDNSNDVDDELPF